MLCPFYIIVYYQYVWTKYDMLYKEQIFFSTKLFSPISECLTKQTLYMPHTNLHKKNIAKSNWRTLNINASPVRLTGFSCHRANTTLYHHWNECICVKQPRGSVVIRHDVFARYFVGHSRVIELYMTYEL